MQYSRIVAQRPALWAAAVVTVVIGAAVFWSVRQTDREREPNVGAVDDSESPPAPVEDYLRFVAAVPDSQSGLSDDRMAEGLRKLAGALGTLNIGSPDLLIDLRVGAEHILLNPASAETTATIRAALVATADTLDRGTETGRALQGAAESIRSDQPLAEQRMAVLHFFRQAADAIQRWQLD
jgi:hypothetical protein